MNVPLPERLAGEELAGLWARCWKAMARAGPDQWREVTIRLPLEGDAERRAVAGLLGRPVRPGTASVGIDLADLDAVLRRADDGWGLAEVVTAASGPLPDRAGDARAQQAAVAATLEQAREAAPDEPWVEPWLDGLAQGMLTRLHGRGELELVPTAARVLARLPGRGTPLPALASEITGNPKALAGTTLEGLVLRALAIREQEPPPRSAADRRALWETAGVVPDDLASQVLVLGVPAVPVGTLGRWLAEARDEGWPLRVTLHQLQHSPITVERPRPVFVCENPAVLRAAAERLGPASAPLVCTEGRPSLACTRLLSSLGEAGCELRYHGDFDWPGLRIAAALLSLPGAVPWRLSAADYSQAVARLEGDRPTLRGPAADSPWDPDLAVAMAQRDTAVYEEEVLDDLLADLDDRAHAADQTRRVSG